MVTRILTSSCDKCQGALKQSHEDPKEWSCMNCGKLFLFLTPQEEEIQETYRHKRPGTAGPQVPGKETKRRKSKTILEETQDNEVEGDDAEWNRLNGRS